MLITTRPGPREFIKLFQRRQLELRLEALSRNTGAYSTLGTASAPVAGCQNPPAALCSLGLRMIEICTLSSACLNGDDFQTDTYFLGTGGPGTGIY